VSPLFWKDAKNMSSRRSEVLITKFLRDALAVGALGVPELEARPERQDLLGEPNKTVGSAARNEAAVALSRAVLRSRRVSLMA
jgi:hypothetical protein